VLKVAFDAGSAPYSYVDNSGRPGGMAADYLSYLGRTRRTVPARAGGTLRAIRGSAAARQAGPDGRRRGRGSCR
jgi:hypothetical protein